MKPRLTLAQLGHRTVQDNIVVPPLGLMSIASWVREKGLADVTIHTQRLDNWSDDVLARQMIADSPDFVGISSTTHSLGSMQYICKALREALPDAAILAGGPHVSAVGGLASLRSVEADFAVPGEGEQAVELILRHAMNGHDYAGIPGIAWRDEADEIILNPGTVPKIGNLDTLPFLAYDLLDLPKFWSLRGMGVYLGRRYAGLSTSRGCPYDCNWCHCIHGKRFRGQSAERILAEMEALIQQYDIECFEFYDDVFNLDSGRLLDFCEGKVERGLDFHFSFPSAVRADIITNDEIDALVDCGLDFSSFALESGSPRIQEFSGKRLNIGKLVDAVEHTASKGIYTNGFAMMGHPTETEEDLQMTIDVARESRLHACQFFIVTPYPGTPLYRWAEQNVPDRLTKVQYTDSNFFQMKANLSEVPDDVLFAYQRNAYRSFYSIPSRWIRIPRDIPSKRMLMSATGAVVRRLFRPFFRRVA